MRMRLWGAFLALATLPAAGLAKCAAVHYTVEGAVTLPAGISPGDVKVFLFVDGVRRVSEMPATRSQPDFQVPNADGSFRLESWLSTASGDPHSVREECNKVGVAGEVVVIGKDVYARRVRFSFSPSRRQIRRTLEASARVSRIELEVLPP